MHLEFLLPHDDVQWSVSIRTCDGTPLWEASPHSVLPTASIAKVHLLLETAACLVTGDLDPLEPLDRRSVPPVRDSGLWQHLTTDVLPLIDVARLIGALSDNLATNVLLDRVGLDAVQRRARAVAPDGSMLHDVVRDARGRSDPPTLSEGTASDWSLLFATFGAKASSDSHPEQLVLDWLAPGTDLSMVAAAFGLDPLSHAEGPDRGLRLWNKTGTDAGVRGDVGLIETRESTMAYAVLCRWDETVGGRRDDVLLTMRRIGEELRSSLSRQEHPSWT